MGTLNPNLPTSELSRLLTTAAGKMEEYRKNLLTPQLVLHTIFEEKKSGAYRILQQLAKQNDFRMADLQYRAENMARFTDGRDAHFSFTDDFGKEIPLSDEMLVVLDEGLSVAKARDEIKVGSGHALAVMTTSRVTTAGALQKVGVNQAAILALLDTVSGGEASVIYDFVTLAEHGELAPMYERKNLLRHLMSLLSLSKGRNVMLIGPEGVGKRTLVQGLAQYVIEGRVPNLRSVVQMNEVALLENPLQTLRVGLRRASGGVLLVPQLERFFGGRLKAQFPEQVCRDLHKAILSEDQVIIGTATPDVFEQLRREDIVRQNMHRLDVSAPDKSVAYDMVEFHDARIEQEYELMMTTPALHAAVDIASTYIKNIELPASAIKLAEQAAALVRLVAQGHELGLANDGRVDSEDIMYAASQMTKIPITKLDEDEQGKYANMVERLQERIIGQEEAITAVSRAVKVARVGLRDPKRPIGSFIFLGPSGVGKSELAKALAEFMFGSEEQMLVLDMSEYQEEASLNRLIGSPPGYVGYEGGGQLTNYVRDNPYTVVLFDEVEKAHQRVFDVLLQVLDEGRLTDGQGNLTTFSETVVIMTSNLGARNMLVPVIGDIERGLVMEEVDRFFRPEFLNRVDDIIMFHQLTPEQLEKILGLLLKKEFKLAAQQGLDLAMTPAARTWLLDQNDQPEYGARPLRRLIARYLREPLADHLLNAGVSVGGGGTVILVDAGDDGLQFNVVQNES